MKTDVVKQVHGWLSERTSKAGAKLEKLWGNERLLRTTVLVKFVVLFASFVGYNILSKQKQDPHSSSLCLILN